MTAPLNSTNPSLPSLEDAKQGIQTFAVFYYQSLRDAGYSEKNAKDYVADLLSQQYDYFCEQGKMDRLPLGSLDKKLTKVLTSVKDLAKDHPEWRHVYTDLVSIQSQMKR